MTSKLASGGASGQVAGHGSDLCGADCTRAIGAAPHTGDGGRQSAAVAADGALAACMDGLAPALQRYLGQRLGAALCARTAT